MKIYTPALLRRAAIKYADDTKLSQVIACNSSVSNKQTLLNQLLIWSDQNNMHIYSSKTKKMIRGRDSKIDWPLLTIRETSLERVSVFKLFGVYIGLSADTFGKLALTIIILWPPYVIGQATYIFILWFLLSSFLWPPCVADADIIFLSCGFFYLLSSFFFFTARRNVVIARALLATAIPSVCPSVCPSHAGIVSKRRHVARCSLHCSIAKCL